MSGKYSPVKIGILGHVGNKNLGDEAIIAAVVENIKERIPEAHIIGYAINPEDTTARHGIPAFPIRRIVTRKSNINSNAFFVQTENSGTVAKNGLGKRMKDRIKKMPRCFRVLKQLRTVIGELSNIPKEILFLRECYRNISGVQLLIIAGSQQVIDYVGGPWAFPYTLFKWSLIARCGNAKVAFLSVGAGPIYTSLGRFFGKKALCFAEYRSYRDGSSLRCVKELGFREDSVVSPDLAFSLKVFQSENCQSGQGDNKVVGINPVPFDNGKNWIGGSDSAYRNYIEKLGLFGLWLIGQGYKVHLFPTQLNLDPRVISDIRQIMEENISTDLDKHLVDKPIHNLEELLGAISCMEFVVASRYHGHVLAYALNKPVLGIAYQPKTADLMRLMQQEDYVLDLQNLELEEMKRKFRALERSANEAKEKIQRKTSACRETLADQYDQVIRLV